MTIIHSLPQRTHLSERQLAIAQDDVRRGEVGLRCLPVCVSRGCVLVVYSKLTYAADEHFRAVESRTLPADPASRKRYYSHSGRRAHCRHGLCYNGTTADVPADNLRDVALARGPFGSHNIGHTDTPTSADTELLPRSPGTPSKHNVMCLPYEAPASTAGTHGGEGQGVTAHFKNRCAGRGRTPRLSAPAGPRRDPTRSTYLNRGRITLVFCRLPDTSRVHIA